MLFLNGLEFGQCRIRFISLDLLVSLYVIHIHIIGSHPQYQISAFDLSSSPPASIDIRIKSKRLV